MLALVGLLGIVLFIVLLARNKTIMPAAFVIVILLIPLCLGIPLNEISGYITDGIASTATLGIMAAFAILFFTLMNKLASSTPLWAALHAASAATSIPCCSPRCSSPSAPIWTAGPFHHPCYDSGALSVL